MENLLDSVSNLPWPMFLLILVLVVVTFVYFQILIPSFKEIDTLRELINTKLANMETNLNIIEKKISNIQSTFSNKGDIYVEKIGDIETNILSLKRDLDKQHLANERLIDKMSDIKERLLIIQNSKVSDEHRGVK